MLGLTGLDSLLPSPGWKRLVIGVVAIAALAGGSYYLGVSPIYARVAALRAQRESQREELTRLRAMATELARIRREAAEVERQLEIAKDKLPTEREIPGLYRAVSDAAVQAGLIVALFQPQAPRVRDFYSEIPIALVAEGGYHELGDFIGRVAALPRAAAVSELKLSATGAQVSRPTLASSVPPFRQPSDPTRPRASVLDAGKPRRSVKAEMTLLTYVYRPVGSPPAPKPAATPTKAEPAKP